MKKTRSTSLFFLKFLEGGLREVFKKKTVLSGLFISLARLSSPIIIYFTLGLDMKSILTALYGDENSFEVASSFVPVIFKGENNIKLENCFDTFPDVILLQLISIVDSGMSVDVVMPSLALFDAMMDSTFFRIAALVVVSEMLFCFSMIEENKSRMAVPATRTNIQLNCISNPFLSMKNHSHFETCTVSPIPSSFKLILPFCALTQ